MIIFLEHAYHKLYANLNKYVFKRVLKLLMVSAHFITWGNWFQSFGAQVEKKPSPHTSWFWSLAALVCAVGQYCLKLEVFFLKKCCTIKCYQFKHFAPL